MSIGEVLSLLKDEFPDITISKIRFLESQGLLDPERTPSGYRKFYPADVERLRWILRQQKEHFLPLKVIKGRLGMEVGDDDDPAAGPATVAVADPEAGPVGDEPAAGATPAVAGAHQPASARSSDGVPTEEAPAAPARAQAATGRPATGERSAPPVMSAGLNSVTLTLEELASASGTGETQLRELERYGLIAGRPVAGTTYYDEEALIIARLAGRFAQFGVEARHLRMYKTAAERESAFYEQIVTPLMKQRNPQARARAVSTVDELAELGQQLRASVLRQALRPITGA